MIVSAAEDSQGEAAAGKWFDRAKPTFHCIVDETHEISRLFGWVNVPCAAWIDEEGRIVRSNEGAYAGRHELNTGIARVSFGSTAFAEATRDWVEKGARSEHVWPEEERARHFAPLDEDELLAEPTFRLGVHFARSGDAARAQRHFSAAQRLAPRNWNFHRQGWTHRGTLHALRMWFRKKKALGDTPYYEPMGLPGETAGDGASIEFLWTPVVRRIKRWLGVGR